MHILELRQKPRNGNLKLNQMSSCQASRPIQRGNPLASQQKWLLTVYRVHSFFFRTPTR